MAALDHDFYDELVAADGQPRPHARTLVEALEALGPEALTQAGRRRDAIFMQQGITFDAGGPGRRRRASDRPFPLDLVPRIIPADEWTTIKRGLAQRIRALNHFVDDVYHAREIIHDGKVPWQLVVSRPAFARAAHGIRPPGGVYCHVSGCDLVRDADGAWKVLEDNVRTPSRHLLRAREPARDDAPAARRCSSTTACGPSTTTRRCCEPRWRRSRRPAGRRRRPSSSGRRARTTAPTSSTRSWRARWASSSSRRPTSWSATRSATSAPPAACSACTRSTGGSTTTSWTRSSSGRTPCSACPGLMRAYRAGSVAIVNAVGTGVADDKAIYHYVPEMIRYYLGEEPIVENVPTYLMSDREQREWVLERLDQVVVKPTSESGGKGVFIGPTRDRARSSRRRRRRSSACRSAGSRRTSCSSRPCRPPGPDGALAAAPRRSAPVRGLRRRHPDRPGRAHARRAARGLDDRQLQPGRRVQGHLGARGGRRRARTRRAPLSTWSPPRMPGLPLGGAWSSQQQQQQQ